MLNTELQQGICLSISAANAATGTTSGSSDEGAVGDYDWIGDTVVIIANACNFCGDYDVKQVGFEWNQERQQQQQQKQTWSSNDLEVELYRKFLFDESSVGGYDT